MNELRRRMLSGGRADGFTLVEVVVAMFIFSLVITGSMYAMIAVTKVVRDTRSAQVAANLAAEEIDAARDVPDLFDLVSVPARTVRLNGDTFTVRRDAVWQSDVGDIKCGSGGGALRFKRVNVTVTWEGMRSGTSPARSDTVIDSRSRINNPMLGTILISTINAAGTGVEGATVTVRRAATNPGTAVTPLEPIDRTDSEGCTYALRVAPGNYDVTVSKGNFIDVDQKSPSIQTVAVSAGATSGRTFYMDDAAEYQLSFPVSSLGLIKQADTQRFAFLNDYRHVVTTLPTNNKIKLFPREAGYQIIAGPYKATSEANSSCLAVDPQEWAPYMDGATTYSASRPTATVVAPGKSDSAVVPMGLIEVKNANNHRHIRAVYTKGAPSTGDPGCVDGMVYDFTNAFGSNAALRSAFIALPYGTWKIFTGGGSSIGTVTAVSSSNLVNHSGGPPPSSDGLVSLDPRKKEE